MMFFIFSSTPVLRVSIDVVFILSTTLKFDTGTGARYSQNISTSMILAALYRCASVMQYIHMLLSTIINISFINSVAPGKLQEPWSVAWSNDCLTSRMRFPIHYIRVATGMAKNPDFSLTANTNSSHCLDINPVIFFNISIATYKSR